jgi:hypothetical protein
MYVFFSKVDKEVLLPIKIFGKTKKKSGLDEPPQR